MRIITGLLLAAGCCVASASAFAADKASASGWITLGGGFVTGEIDLPCNANQSRNQCKEDGTLPTTLVAATIGKQTLLRFRYNSVGELDGANSANFPDPTEMSLSLGSRLGNNAPWIALIGAGRILHPDDDYPGREDGVSAELLFAPIGSDNPFGFEMGIYGFKSRDIEAIGMSFAMRLGSLD